jgi:hypothetical protein
MGGAVRSQGEMTCSFASMMPAEPERSCPEPVSHALHAATSGRFATPIAVGRGYEGNSFQCPSETTSTVPPVTLMAVWSSIAYAGPAISAAHLSAPAMVLSGM